MPIDNGMKAKTGLRVSTAQDVQLKELEELLDSSVSGGDWDELPPQLKGMENLIKVGARLVQTHPDEATARQDAGEESKRPFSAENGLWLYENCAFVKKPGKSDE